MLELINWLCEGFLSNFSQMRSKSDEFLCFLLLIKNKYRYLVKGKEANNIEYKFDVLQENMQHNFVLFYDIYLLGLTFFA